MPARGQTKEHRKIKQDLLDQLERNGTYGEYFIDQVEDYMALWKVKNGLKSDIEIRGSKVEKHDSRGQVQTVNNESIDQMLKVNGQMLRILGSLGIRPVEAESVMDDDDAL